MRRLGLLPLYLALLLTVAGCYVVHPQPQQAQVRLVAPQAAPRR